MEITNEKLIAQASHARINLSVLAILASFVCALTAISVFRVYGRPPAGALSMVGAAASVAAGYWALSVAAKRGNPLAVGIALVFVALQGVLYLGSYVVRGRESPLTTPAFVVVILLIVGYALVKSRSVLVKLRERELWDSLFGDALPSHRLCVAGGILLALGLGGSYVASARMATEISKEINQETEQAQAFLDMLKGEEPEFGRALKNAVQDPSSANVGTAVAKLKALQQQTETIADSLASESPMKGVLAHYRIAMYQWEQALDLLGRPEPDTATARTRLREAEQSRAEAGDFFNECYAREGQ
jgi:hypothetical protein